MNKIIIWVLRILAAALFLFAGTMKLIGAPMMVHDFDVVGLGQWLRYLTGLMEMTGGIIILIPAVSAFGAALLMIVDIGAFVAQVTALHEDWIHTIVIGAVLSYLVYAQRGQITARLGRPALAREG